MVTAMSTYLRMFLCAAMTSVVACGDAADDDAAPASVAEQPIINGTAYAGHPAVMMFLTQGQGYYGTCTATLIAPNKLLTAAHCVEDFNPATEKALVSNLQKPRVGTPGDWQPVARVDIHPAWATQHYINEGHDCAVLTLAANYPNVEPLAVSFDAAAVVRGTPVTLIGYGNNVAGSGSGQKRVGSGTIQDVYDGVIGAAGASQRTCQGDSGGGLIAKIGGVEKVVGVTSYGSPGCVGLGYFTNVAKTCDAFVRQHVPN